MKEPEGGDDKVTDREVLQKKRTVVVQNGVHALYPFIPITLWQKTSISGYNAGYIDAR